jgi:hypothetical protein
MTTASGNIIEVVSSLTACAEYLRAGEPMRRVEMAFLFEQISNGLAALAGRIRHGEDPGEADHAGLIVFGRQLSRAVEKELGAASADSLGSQFSSGGDLGSLRAAGCNGIDESTVIDLEVASGRFRSLIQLLDILPYRADNAVVVDLGQTFMAVLREMANRAGIEARELAAAGVMKFLEDREDFGAAVNYVLAKNRDLYHRLRQGDQ